VLVILSEYRVRNRVVIGEFQGYVKLVHSLQQWLRALDGTCACICAFISVCTCVCVFPARMCAFKCMCLGMCICACVCVCVCVCVVHSLQRRYRALAGA
jgi:hypothetical protein